MGAQSAIRDVVEPLVTGAGLELFDLEHTGGVVRVTVDQPGHTADAPDRGVDLDQIATLTRAISRALDERDPIAGRYTLEVSSPGLERPLRTIEHRRWAVGRQVSVKTVPSFEGDRRLQGTLVAADDAGVTLRLDDGAEQRIAHDDIDKARTIFEWGPAPKPGGPRPKAGRGTGKPTTEVTSP